MIEETLTFAKKRKRGFFCSSNHGKRRW